MLSRDGSGAELCHKIVQIVLSSARNYRPGVTIFEGETRWGHGAGEISRAALGREIDDDAHIWVDEGIQDVVR